MFILSAKYGNAWRWSSVEEPVSPLYLGRCSKYPGWNASRFWGKTKAPYLACTIGWNAIVEDGVWDVYVDVEKEEEEDGDKEGVYLCGGEEGGDEEWGDLLYDFKGVLITNF